MQKNPHPVLAGMALVGLLANAGCGATSPKLGITVDPPTASVYLNGEKIGSGGSRVHEIDFGPYERVCIQAIARGCEPEMIMLTREGLADQIRQYRELTWTLKQER